MFGNKKLLANGAQAQGIVTASDDVKVLVNGAGGYAVTISVTFDDGTSQELETRLHTKDVGMKGIGSVLPVRYDPSDRSKIAVDEPAIRASRELQQTQRETAFAAISSTPPVSSDPAEQLQALWEQKKAMDVRGSELSRSGAPREQVGVWVSESEALNSRFRALKLQHPEWTPKPSS